MVRQDQGDGHSPTYTYTYTHNHTLIFQDTLILQTPV